MHEPSLHLIKPSSDGPITALLLQGTSRSLKAACLKASGDLRQTWELELRKCGDCVVVMMSFAPVSLCAKPGAEDG